MWLRNSGLDAAESFSQITPYSLSICKFVPYIPNGENISILRLEQPTSQRDNQVSTNDHLLSPDTNITQVPPLLIFSLPMAQQSFSWARSTSLEHKISWKIIKSGWPVLQKSILSCYCICSSVTREKTDFMCRTVWFVAWAFESSLSEYVLPPV